MLLYFPIGTKTVDFIKLSNYQLLISKSLEIWRQNVSKLSIAEKLGKDYGIVKIKYILWRDQQFLR